MYIIYVNNTLPLAHEISRHFWAAYGLTQAIIRDKLQRLKHTQDICTRQLITMFKCARALDKSNLYCC